MRALTWVGSWLFLEIALVVVGAPLRQFPANPHYLEYRGRPTVLLTSGEHYGAVLNLDFDYRKYLDTLAKDGLNLTRTFSGAYVEPLGAFGIARNTLAPGPERFVAPWARSDQPGYAGGDNGFDLDRWDPAYFDRLKDFLRYAARRGVVVEMNLFCPFYDESQWALSPQNADNNIQRIGAVARTNVYTLDRHGGLLHVQEAMVRKVATELNGFDNLYYEICNEPYFGGVTEAWQRHMADVIVATERSLPRQHFISQNIANGAAVVRNPHPAVAILNFHYAHPPDAVAQNRSLRRVIGDNETGFRGTNDLPYRVEAWSFLMAGGGLFNHLDYSFVVGHESGDFVYPASQPGGGNPGFRKQLRVLAGFVADLRVWELEPVTDLAVVAGGEDRVAYGLGKAGGVYGVYLAPRVKDWKNPPRFADRASTVGLTVSAGRYRLTWLEPSTGRVVREGRIRHGGGGLQLETPPFQEDLAFRLSR